MRTRKEIDQEYTSVAAHYGDMLFKLSHLQEQTKGLFVKMKELSEEPAAADGDVEEEAPKMECSEPKLDVPESA